MYLKEGKALYTVYIIIIGNRGLGTEEAKSAGGDSSATAAQKWSGVAAGGPQSGLSITVSVTAGCEARDKAGSTGRESICRNCEWRYDNGGSCRRCRRDETEQTQFIASRIRQQPIEFAINVRGAEGQTGHTGLENGGDTVLPETLDRCGRYADHHPNKRHTVQLWVFDGGRHWPHAGLDSPDTIVLHAAKEQLVRCGSQLAGRESPETSELVTPRRQRRKTRIERKRGPWIKKNGNTMMQGKKEVQIFNALIYI